MRNDCNSSAPLENDYPLVQEAQAGERLAKPGHLDLREAFRLAVELAATSMVDLTGEWAHLHLANLEQEVFLDLDLSLVKKFPYVISSAFDFRRSRGRSC